MAKADETPVMVQAVVAPRRSVVVQTKEGAHRRAVPGEIVNVSAETAATLRAGGFLMQGDAPLSAEVKREAITDAKPTVNGRDGSTVGVPDAR